MEEENLEALPRHDLQQRAKELGIKANQKSSELIAAIRSKTLNVPVTPKTPAVGRKMLSLSTPPWQNSSRSSSPQPGEPGSTDRSPFSAIPRPSQIGSPLNLGTFQQATSKLPGATMEPRFISARIQSLAAKFEPSQQSAATKRVNFVEPASESKPSKPASTEDTIAKVRQLTENRDGNESGGNGQPTLTKVTAYNLKDAMRQERERRRSLRNATPARVEHSEWERVESRSKRGQYYYWNATLQLSSWELPS